MDKDKILRLCNEIEDIATEIQERTMKDSYFMAQTIINKVLVIAAEINEPPKTNGDHIRKMADEELAEWFAPHMMCDICDKKNKPVGCNRDECRKYALVYMKHGVSEDA